MNSYRCNNFLSQVISFKSNALHITERYKKWLFSLWFALQYYNFIHSFLPLQLKTWLNRNKFIKRTIDQFSIELYQRFAEDELFNFSVNSFKATLLRSFMNAIFAWTKQLQLRVNQATDIPEFCYWVIFQYHRCFLVFPYKCLFLFSNLKVSFVVKLLLPGATSLFEVMAFSGIVPFKEKLVIKNIT